MPRSSSTSTPGTEAGGGRMTRAELVSLFERRQTAYDNLDAAALAADYADDCVVDSPTGGTHTGRAAVQQILEGVFDAFLDMKTRTDTLLIDDERVAQIMTVEGSSMGGFLGVPASGKPFRLTAAFVYELKDRRIVRERRIYDFTGLLTQIGVLRARPA